MEYAQIVTDISIQLFQYWGIYLIVFLPKTAPKKYWIIVAVDYATGWPVVKAVVKATEDSIAEFIFNEIYMHFGAPQEIFSNEGKNLQGGVVQAYLRKIGIVYKGASSYHLWTNAKSNV